MGRRYPRRQAKRAPRRKQVRRRKALARRSAVPEYASCKATRDLGYDSMGNIYKFSEFSIGGWLRPANIAENYQFYRIALIEMKFIPVNDTYIAGNPGEVPNLYYIVDKADTTPQAISNADLMNMGAKPLRFDDKTISVKFKPAVVWKALDENGTGNNFGMIKVSPWLSTNDNNTSDTAAFQLSSVDHHGIVYSVQGGTAGANYRVECTAHFEFKKPLSIPLTGQAPPPVINKRLDENGVVNV